MKNYKKIIIKPTYTKRPGSDRIVFLLSTCKPIRFEKIINNDNTINVFLSSDIQILARVVIFLILYKKYNGRHCYITYKYTFYHIEPDNDNFIVNIKNGKFSPEIKINGIMATYLRITKIKYLHWWYNLIAGIFGANIYTELISP